VSSWPAGAGLVAGFLPDAATFVTDSWVLIR
jgi:hypothetical protein